MKLEDMLMWQSRPVLNEATLFFHGEQVGSLRGTLLSQSVDAEMNGKRYLFRREGLFGKESVLVDADTNRVAGTVKHSLWLTSAWISIQGEVYEFRLSSRLRSIWSIQNSFGPIIGFAKRSSVGFVESEAENPLLILIGVYCIGLYQRAINLLVIIFSVLILVRFIFQL